MPPDSQVFPSPYVLIRYNLLPADSGARPDRLWAQLDRLDELERWKEAHAERIADYLYGLVSRVTDEQRKRILLPLRRDVFNNRLPGRYQDRVAEVTQDELIRQWLATQQEVGRLTAEIAEEHPERLAAERARLAEVCQQEEFQRAFVLSSTLAFRAQAEYLGDAAADRKRARRAEASLLRYYTRAIAKTSPFSRYTAVAFGRWSDHPEAVSGAGPLGAPDLAPQSLVRINHLLVLRLVDLAVRRPGGMHALRYRLARHTRFDGEKIRFEVDADDPVAQPRVHQTSEKVVALRNRPTVAALVQWLRERPEGVLFQELEQMLRSAGGAAAPHKTTAFLEKLVTAGLLVPELGLDEQDPKFLDHSVRLLESLPEESCRTAASHLQVIADQLARFGDQPATERDSTLRDVKSRWSSAYRALGASAPDTFPLFEDSYAPRPVAVPRPVWQPTLRSLALVEKLAMIFDDYHVLHCAVRTAFVAQLGRGGSCDLGELAALLPDAYERAWTIATAWPETIDTEDPDIRAQLTLRRTVIAKFAEGMGDPDSDYHVDPQFITDLYDELPARIRQRWTAWSLFLQPELRGGTLHRVVLNKMYAGLGQFVSRFLPLFGDDSTATVRDHLRGFFPGDRVLTHLRPVFGFNANIQPLLASDEIDWQSRPGSTAIDVDDVVVRHDPGTDQLLLYRRSTQERLEVLYLGFLVAYALPYRLASFYAVNGRGQMQLNFTDLVDRGRADQSVRVRRYPRLQLGNVVLARRRWYVPNQLVPLRRQHESEPAYFVRLNLWRRRHELPAQVFVKELPEFDPERFAVSGDQLQREVTRLRAKPQFLDLGTALGARMFDRWMRSATDDLQLEEVLPALSDAALATDRGRHAAEVVVELNRRAAGWGDSDE